MSKCRHKYACQTDIDEVDYNKEPNNSNVILKSFANIFCIQKCKHLKSLPPFYNSKIAVFKADIVCSVN